ncbi:hypothetical protein B566_EDAN006340 [Ephemera danica]|nr:hypothetical protein B566_EDAN006340 [Ephemera danica]
MWGHNLVLILLIVTRNVQPSPLCPEDLRLELPEARLLDNSSLLAGNLVYPPETFWRDDATNVYFGCPCKVTSCIRICPAYEMENTSSIVDVDDEFKLQVKHEDTWLNVSATEHFAVVHGSTCQKVAMLDPHDPLDQVVILSNGSLQYTNNVNDLYNVDHFCLLPNSTGSINVYICLDNGGGGPEKPLQFYLYPVLLLVSVVFLALTLLAFLLAFDGHNQHSYCLTFYCTCLLLGFIGLAFIQITGHDSHIVICNGLAYGTYFFLMAAFFWLNVMAFDIWWTFRRMRTSQASRKKLAWYCIYACVMPTSLLVITLIMELTVTLEEHMEYQPGIGQNKCWFQNKTTEFIYFNGPVAIILAFNLLFFILTAIKLVFLWKEGAALENGESRTHNRKNKDKQRFVMYLKLFIVMGLSWSLEILSWAIGGPDESWYVTDSINLLQGLWIFILCVWLTKQRKVLLKRILPKRLSNHFVVQPEQQDTGSSEVSETGVTSPTVEIPNVSEKRRRSVEVTKL